MNARVALVGHQGAGKSTFAAALKAVDSQIMVLPMARPLYAAQAALLDHASFATEDLPQDGELLSLLGTEMRRRDRDSLTRRVIDRANWLQSAMTDSVVVVSDARPTDLAVLRDGGFVSVFVAASPAVRDLRLLNRKDLSPNPDRGGVEPTTEDLEADFVVVNDGTLEDLHEAATGLLRALPSRPSFEQGGPHSLLGGVLREQAEAMITKLYRPSRHQLACAMLGSDGEIALGLHVEAEVGRASSCAENGALAQIVARRARPVGIITVRHPRPGEDRGVEVVPPCGICRELLCGYGEDALVWLSSGPVRLKELLPSRYAGSKWRNES